MKTKDNLPTNLSALERLDREVVFVIFRQRFVRQALKSFDIDELDAEIGRREGRLPRVDQEEATFDNARLRFVHQAHRQGWRRSWAEWTSSLHRIRSQ